MSIIIQSSTNVYHIRIKTGTVLRGFTPPRDWSFHCQQTHLYQSCRPSTERLMTTQFLLISLLRLYLHSRHKYLHPCSSDMLPAQTATVIQYLLKFKIASAYQLEIKKVRLHMRNSNKWDLRHKCFKKTIQKTISLTIKTSQPDRTDGAIMLYAVSYLYMCNAFPKKH